MKEVEVSRTFDLLARMQRLFPKEDALAGKFGGKWVKYSTEDYVRESHLLAYGFLEMGLERGDKVITITPNRPAWNFIDMGLAMANLVHVPIYSTLNTEEFKYIAMHSDAKVIIIGSKSLYKRFKPLADSLPSAKKIICIDPTVGEICLEDITDMGRQKSAKWKFIVDEIKETTSPDTVVTIIYTSGTTGTPKGVMLTHRNLVYNFTAHAALQNNDNNSKMLSFLPLCHIFERSMNYEYQMIGASIYYAESLSSIIRDSKEIHADGFCAVPRILEMIYKKFVEHERELKGLRRHIYHWALNVASKFDYNKTIFYRLKLKIADKLVLKKWRNALGGHKMLIVAGGAATKKKITRTLSAAKLFVTEGYGMTETSPVIAVNHPKGRVIIGTVGEVLQGIEVKIADDGEILTRGPHVMAGYYKNPEATAEIIDSEGWLHTGDIGQLRKDNVLKITDRKKELFKLANGKYIAPQPLELKLNESEYILNSFVIGLGQKTVAAILLPNLEKLYEWARQQGISTENTHGLLKDKCVLQLYHKEIGVINKELAPFEQINRFALSDAEWTIKNGLLSQTQKLKRKALEQFYKDLISRLYSKL